MKLLFLREDLLSRRGQFRPVFEASWHLPDPTFYPHSSSCSSCCCCVMKTSFEPVPRQQALLTPPSLGLVVPIFPPTNDFPQLKRCHVWLKKVQVQKPPFGKLILTVPAPLENGEVQQEIKKKGRCCCKALSGRW